MQRETLKEFIDRNHSVESQKRIKEQSDLLLEEVDNVDLWLCKPSLRTHDNLPNQIRMMIDFMCESKTINSAETKLNHIIGFINGLLYAGFIGHEEHREYDSDITNACVETLDRLDDSFRGKLDAME